MLQRYFWDNSKETPAAFQHRIDRLWFLALLALALLLFTVNLGGLPLRDWDEGTVAQVARDIWRAEPGSHVWLHPTISGMVYFNKPPLMHWLIAFSYRLGGVNEWTTRLPGALLTAISVPLLYSIGREIFPRRLPALFAALVYLTFLPVVRHGRLAMLDGAILCFFLLMLLCLLRSRRDLRWGLGAGIGFGLLFLTKGIIALLLGAIALLFILWDTPRLLTSGYAWAGLLLGSLPIGLWYGAQWLRYGQAFIEGHFLTQGFARIGETVGRNAGDPWYYLLEILKYGMPWLLFLPMGFRLVWNNRTLSWAKLVLVWSSVYLLVISGMSTKLPWYVLPLYPALALITGGVLADIWQSSDLTGMPDNVRRSYPACWGVGLGVAAVAGWGSSVYFLQLASPAQPNLALILATVALMMTVALWLVVHRNSQFILVLLWGSYLSLFLLMISDYWIWELEEAYPVKPVADLVRQNTPPGQEVMTLYPEDRRPIPEHPHDRPSLNFYSDRRITPRLKSTIEAEWKTAPHPYLLIHQSDLGQLQLESNNILGRAEDWILLTRQHPPGNSR